MIFDDSPAESTNERLFRGCPLWTTSPASPASSASLADIGADDAGDAVDVVHPAERTCGEMKGNVLEVLMKHVGEMDGWIRDGKTDATLTERCVETGYKLMEMYRHWMGN